MDKLTVLFFASVLLISSCKANEAGVIKSEFADFDINEAYTQLMYSYAAYCPKAQIQAWNCFFCTYNSSDTSGFIVNTVVDNPLTSTFGYVGIRKDTVEVVFRGTSDLENWIEDLYYAQEPAPYPNVTGAAVHTGFMDAYNAVKPKVRAAVASLVSSPAVKRVVFTGHSLGAALATLCAADIAPTLKIPYLMYNFGSPRVGNLGFSTYFNSLVPTVYRVVNMADTVPHVPLQAMKFHHVSREVWYQTATTYKLCDTSGEDKTCSDSVLKTSTADHTIYMQIKLEQGGC